MITGEQEIGAAQVEIQVVGVSELFLRKVTKPYFYIKSH